MDRRVYVYGKAKDLRSETTAKASLKMAFSRWHTTRNLVIYPWPA